MHYRVSIRPLPSLVTLVVIVILCKLGIWQLTRAQDKQQMLDSAKLQPQMGVSQLQQVISLGQLKQFDGARLSGNVELMSDYLWLVDNKVYQGQVGYSVLVPAKFERQDLYIMLDLGWIPAASNRDELPQLTLPPRLEVKGLIKTANFSQFMLQSEQPLSYWPQRIQSNNTAFEGQYPFTVTPLLLYVTDNQKLPLPQIYKPVVMLPEKHYAYATQWFLLAFVCGLIFIFASVKTSPKWEGN